jgi:uncharacterized protein
LLFAFLIPQGPAIPPPRGLVNDFAGVIDAAHAARIERMAAYVRDRSGGEIAVVTMKDIGGREANDVALRIGRAWGVGAKAAVGDRRRNAGVVILVVPKESAADNRGQVAVENGQGAEGFISDATAGEIWRAAIPQLRERDYGAALELITYGVAERYAKEFGFSMDSLRAVAPERPPPERQSQGSGFGVVLFGLVVLLVFASIARRRGGGGLRSALPWIILNAMQSGGRSRGGSSSWGGGWGGGGGGGGGGFGGFGGGGGFSGGGSHGSW